MFNLKSIQVSDKWWRMIIFLSAVIGFTAGCRSNSAAFANANGEVPGSVNNSSRVASGGNALVAGTASPAGSREDGGDRLPIVVDPKSPGSCAVVAKGDQCGECCSDVFNEESEQWSVCMNACIKADATMHEH